MSIKRMPPEAIETFSMVLHPRRSYSFRLPVAGVVPPGPSNALTTEGSDDLTTEASDILTTEA